MISQHYEIVKIIKHYDLVKINGKVPTKVLDDVEKELEKAMWTEYCMLGKCN